MVVHKELVTLYKIKKVNEEIEQIIPFEVAEGTYDENNCTFTTLDGTVYLHIEETEYPNFGYARRLVTEVAVDNDEELEDDLDYLKIKKFDTDNAYKYLRFSSEINKIYIKDKVGSAVMVDDDSKHYKERMKEYDQEEPQNSLIEIDKTPKEIEEEVKKTIKGQDEAIRKIVTCLWATINNRDLSKKQMLVIGPTGVGKTAIFKKLSQILNVPVIVFSVPGLSQSGYVGRSTEEILKQVYYECDREIDLAKHAIVILDEFDKLAYNGNDKSGDISTVGVQNELLKLIEGCKRVVEMRSNEEEDFEIDTTNMIFIATGAFQELYEKKPNKLGFNKEPDKIEVKKKITTDDLLKYGIKREILGRLPIIIELNALTKEIFKEIILESDESELITHIKFLKDLGVEITNIEDVIDLIINDAMSKHIGARGLIPTISSLFLEIIYEVANNPGKYNKVTIGTDAINNPFDFKLEERKTNKKTRNKTVKKG